MVIVVIGEAFSPCFAADSPQYMLDLYAVDPATTNLAPVIPIVNPTANVATVGLVVTTKIPVNLSVVDSGFNMWTAGTPKVVVTTTAHTVTSRQNADGSTTTMYTFNVSVPDMVYSLYLAFSFWAKVVDVVDQPPVTHESSQLSFQLLGTSTPTPAPTLTPTPSPSPTPTPPPTATPTATATPTPTPLSSPTSTPTTQPTAQPSGTGNPTPTQTSIPLDVNFYWLPFIVSLIIVLIIIVIVVVLLVFRRRRRHSN